MHSKILNTTIFMQSP